MGGLMPEGAFAARNNGGTARMMATPRAQTPVFAKQAIQTSQYPMQA